MGLIPFEEIELDFENFFELQYSEKLKLIDKYSFSTFFVSLNYKEKDIYSLYDSLFIYSKVLQSANPNENKYFNFRPKSEIEKLEFMNWFIRKYTLWKSIPNYTTIFLQDYSKAKNKQKVFENEFTKVEQQSKLNENFFTIWNNKQITLQFLKLGINTFDYGNNVSSSFIQAILNNNNNELFCIFSSIDTLFANYIEGYEISKHYLFLVQNKSILEIGGEINSEPTAGELTASQNLGKKPNQRTLDKNERYIEYVNDYIQRRKAKGIKDAIASTLLNYKSHGLKIKTFQRAIKENLEILNKTEFKDDFKKSPKPRN